MKVICLESNAFYELVDQVVGKMMEQHKEQPKWLVGEDAMNLLGIKSKTTLQKLRNEGEIKYSQPFKKHILYHRQSLLDFLEKHSKDTF